MAYQRRVAVNFQENILLTLSQNIFLAKKENKLRFMNMLEAELPCQCWCRHSHCSKKLLKHQHRQKQLKLVKRRSIGSPYLSDQQKYSGPKLSGRCVNVWDIKMCKESLGSAICNNILLIFWGVTQRPACMALERYFPEDFPGTQTFPTASIRVPK